MASETGARRFSQASRGRLTDRDLDRELDLGKSLEMEEHFRQCATCCQAYEEGRRLRTALNEARRRVENDAAVTSREKGRT